MAREESISSQRIETKPVGAVGLPDGSIYQGRISNLKKEGRARQILSDGSLYEGEFKNDLK